MPGTERFDAPMGEINDVLWAHDLLAWDARTGMPRAGARARRCSASPAAYPAALSAKVDRLAA